MAEGPSLVTGKGFAQLNWVYRVSYDDSFSQSCSIRSLTFAIVRANR
jgi:hypothetical protein